MENEKMERSKELPFSSIRADLRATIGKWTVRSSIPTSISMGLAAYVMENEDILGVSPNILDSPQTAFILAVPPVAVFTVGKVMQASAKVESDGQHS